MNLDHPSLPSSMNLFILRHNSGGCTTPWVFGNWENKLSTFHLWKFLKACFGKSIERGGEGRDQISLVAFGSKNFVFKVHKGRIKMHFSFVVVFSFYLLKNKRRGSRGRCNLDKIKKKYC